jgi:hypothetical protein
VFLSNSAPDPRFINLLNSNKKKYAEIEKNIGDTWLDQFINDFQNNILKKKINYSFAELVKKQFMASKGKKIELLDIQEYDTELTIKDFEWMETDDEEYDDEEYEN